MFQMNPATRLFAASPARISLRRMSGSEPMSMHDHHHSHPQAHSGGADEATHLVKDPVCGMDVDPRDDRHCAEIGGSTYHFCSNGCKTKFVANPGAYIAGTPKVPAPAPEGAIYTCPMHPEVRRNGPGSCPICGMALEREVASEDTGPNPELADMTRRFWIALALTLPVVVLEMGGHLINLHMLIGQKTSNWVQLIFATPVVLWAGYPFFERGAKSLVTRNLNMFTLIALGTGVAWLYSVAATFAPGLFPQAFRGTDGSVAVYFEAAAVITVRAKKCRSTDPFSRGMRRSTSRSSPANPCRLARTWAPRSWPVRSIRAVPSSCAPKRLEATRFFPRS
jgi:P-type Cu+ transporter